MQNIKEKSPKRDDGERPLHRAAYFGHLNVVKYIMENIKEKSPKHDDGETRIASNEIEWEHVSDHCCQQRSS